MPQSQSLNYSVAQRVAHWLMAVLIFFNLIFTDGMEHYIHLVEDGGNITPDDIFGANIHAYVGISILALAIVRFILRMTQGTPAAPADEPSYIKLIAKVTHGLIYLLVFLLPISGMLAYYGGVGAAGEVHAEILKTVLWVVLVLHIGGALAQHFYFKSDSLKRMTTGV